MYIHHNCSAQFNINLAKFSIQLLILNTLYKENNNLDSIEGHYKKREEKNPIFMSF